MSKNVKSASQRVLSELENLYRAIALESKKTNSHLKNSAERAILKLREYRNLKKSLNELSHVLSNDVILRPLILSWTSKNISIALHALNILQKLLNINCISSDSFMQILISLRTLLTLTKNQSSHSSHSSHSLSNLDINIQIKMCQILIQIPNSSSWTVTRPFIQHITYITLLLCQSNEMAVRSTSLAALQQIVTVALEYSVNNQYDNKMNNISNPKIIDHKSDSPMYVFESLFHDLCCLASPELLYLRKSNITHHNHNHLNDDNNQISINNNNINNTLVTFSSLDIKSNNNDNNDNDNIILDDNDIDIIDSASDAVLITNLSNNLSTLRLLDIDFVINSVPILGLLEVLVGSEYFPIGLKYSSGLLHVLQQQLCPLLCKLIKNCNLSDEMIKCGRLIIELLSRHYIYLEIETDRILSELLRLLEPNDYPDWAPIIILEILRHLLKNSDLLKFFYIKYDMNSNSDKRVFGSLIHGLGRFLHQTTNNAPKQTQKWSPKRKDSKYFSFIKDPQNPPLNPKLQVSLAVLSLMSFVEGLAVVCNVTSTPPTSPKSSPKGDLPSFHTTSYPPSSSLAIDNNPSTTDHDDDITLDVSKDIARHMVEVVWRPLLAALSQMLSHSIQESQYQSLLSIYQTTSRICGRIQLIKPLERLLSSMSQHGLPDPFFNYTFSDILFKFNANSSQLALNNMFMATNKYDQMNIGASSGSGSGSGSSSISSSSSSSLSHTSSTASAASATLNSINSSLKDLQHKINNNISHSPISKITNNDLMMNDGTFNNNPTIHISIKNVCTIHALVNIAHGLGSILDSAWSVLLETFEKLDYIFHRQIWQLVDINGNIISPDSHWNDEVNMLDSRLQQLFESSEYLDDNSLCELLSALGHLSSSSLAGLATSLDQSKTSTTSPTINTTSIHGTNKNSLSSDAISVDKVKSFALRKFVQTIEVNIYRLNKIWDDVIAHLHVIMNYKNSTLRHFGIKTLIRIQLKVLTEPINNKNKKRDRAREQKKKNSIIQRNKQNNILMNKKVLKIKITSDDIDPVIDDEKEKQKELEKRTERDKFQKLLFLPYLKLFRSKYPDTRERVIRAVSQLLENSGEYISTGWPTIVELLNYVPISDNNVTLSCLKLAFDDVRLIASDFLDCLPNYCLLGLVKAVGLFGKQIKDNNISYSSIGLLWKISDYITLITNKKDIKNNDIKLKSLINIADGLQIAIFRQLRILCVDSRSDVRNCAMQTINSAIVAYGDKMQLDSWIKCISIIQMLLEDVVVKRKRLNFQQDNELREKLTKREYRAFRKKWNETEKHCIRGGSRICKMFIVKLHQQNEFKIYWNYYLETINKLLDLNPEVASTGITCLQEIAQSNDFILCCSQNSKYWIQIINCYESMIRNVGHKEYEILTKDHDDNHVLDRHDNSNYTEMITLPFGDVCDSIMESIRDLLNPEMTSRKLFSLSQIEKLINNLDFLISDKNLENNMKTQPLEILDARLLRLKKLLLIYEQLPPLAPSIAKPIISKIASYLIYVSSCCHCFHHYSSKMNISLITSNSGNSPNSNYFNLKTKKISKLSLTEKSLLRKTEKTMDFVSQRAITLLNQFYSIHIPHELKVECFEIVINGISNIMDPFLCPISVVTNAIRGFEEVCKTGLPQFSAAQNNNNGQSNNNKKQYKLSSVESLRVWSVLGDVVSIAFRLQHHTNNNNKNHNKKTSSSKNNENKTLQQLVDLKLSILETTMEYILPYGHLAPRTLKKRIVLLLNGNCWSDGLNTTMASIQRHSRLNRASITAMFELCSDTLKNNNNRKYDIELSAMSYQLLIPKISFILDQYIDDEMSKPQNRPLPIYRQKHIIHILNLLKNLTIHPKLDTIPSYFNQIKQNSKLLGKQNNNNNNNQTNNQTNTLFCSGSLLFNGKTKTRPHLFRLYPILCKLIRVKDNEIKNCLCDVFKTFGKEMGLN